MKTAHLFPLGSKEDTLNYFFILKYAIAYTVVEIKYMYLKSYLCICL